MREDMEKEVDRIEAMSEAELEAYISEVNLESENFDPFSYYGVTPEDMEED